MASDLKLPIDLLLVRHGQSEANVVAELYKRGDKSGQEALLFAARHDSRVRLTDLGRQQAHAVGRWVRENAGSVDQYFVSEYCRTRETAGEMGLPNASWTLDLMIRERDQGLNDGRGSAMAFADDEQTEKDRHKRSKMYWSPVGGESVADVCLRVRQFLNMLHTVANGMRVIVVCHHQVINAFRLLLEDTPQTEYESVLDEHMPNGCVFWYTRRDSNGRVRTRMARAKKIDVGLDGAETTVKEWGIQRRTYTNQELLETVQHHEQLVNNDGVVLKEPKTIPNPASRL